MENTMENWIWFLLIGGIIGWLAGLIVKGRGFGIIGDIVVGVVGAMLGAWLYGVLGISTASSLSILVMALIGSVILVSLTRLFRLNA